eukprot:INCI4822.2.p1 GENE.INCI4822.2~~INCI4822.2.p1  ORF type:complete len:700 (+),score=118.06 INCI4822.2:255-2354(+)
MSRAAERAAVMAALTGAIKADDFGDFFRIFDEAAAQHIVDYSDIDEIRDEIEARIEEASRCGVHVVVRHGDDRAHVSACLSPRGIQADDTIRHGGNGGGGGGGALPQVEGERCFPIREILDTGRTLPKSVIKRTPTAGKTRSSLTTLPMPQVEQGDVARNDSSLLPSASASSSNASPPLTAAAVGALSSSLEYERAQHTLWRQAIAREREMVYRTHGRSGSLRKSPEQVPSQLASKTMPGIAPISVSAPLGTHNSNTTQNISLVAAHTLATKMPSKLGSQRREKIKSTTEPESDEMKRKLRALKTLGHDDEAENRAALQTCGGRLRAARHFLKTGQQFPADQPSSEIRDSTDGALSSTIDGLEPQETLTHKHASKSPRVAERKQMQQQGKRKKKGKKKRRKNNATKLGGTKPLDENTTPSPSVASRSHPHVHPLVTSADGAQDVPHELHESGQQHRLHDLYCRKRDSFDVQAADYDDKCVKNVPKSLQQPDPLLDDASLASQDDTGGGNETAEKRPTSSRTEKSQLGGSTSRKKVPTASKAQAPNSISPFFPKRGTMQSKRVDGDSVDQQQQIAVAAAAVAAAEQELKNARAALRAACSGFAHDEGAHSSNIVASASNSTFESNSTDVTTTPVAMNNSRLLSEKPLAADCPTQERVCSNRQQSPRKQEFEGNLGWVFRTQVRPFLDARAAAHLSVRQSE